MSANMPPANTVKRELSLPLLAGCISSDILQLILLPTEACNFRCIYCYESFQYRRMEPWVVDGVKGFVTHRMSGLRHLTISWFGGEPLLAHGIMHDILGHIQALRRDRDVGFLSDATTNGYLLSSSRLRELVDLGVSHYQISFDGPRDYHDSKRLLANGRGSFDRIWGNLLAAREIDRRFQITVRVHVNRENAEAIPQFIREYAAAFGGDDRFEIFIRPLSRLGGPNDPQLPIFERAEAAVVVDRLRKLVGDMGLRQLDSRPTGTICYAAKANSFVIRSNGRINKCTVALEHPANQVGLLQRDGTMRFDSERLGGWLRGLASGDSAELGCPMHGYADTTNLDPATVSA